MRTVRILRGVDNQPVEATLIELTQKHVEDFSTQWQAPLIQATQEDKFWDWAFKHRITSTRDNYEGYAIECDDATQGLMMLETQQHRTQFRRGRPLIYISALSVAPWNRQQLQRAPRFRTVGTALLEFARSRSEELGYEGCIGLHALPGAEGFYERLNMMRFDPEPEDIIDADEELLPYFEYPPDNKKSYG